MDSRRAAVVPIAISVSMLAVRWDSVRIAPVRNGEPAQR